MENGKPELKVYIEDYYEKLNNGNVNDKAKVRFFLDYLRKSIGTEALDDCVVFGIIDKDFLLGSLEAYTNNSPSKQAAGDYRRAIISLCENVCRDYDIKNSFLESAPEKTSYYEESREMIDRLDEPRSRECMSYDDFESLNEEINAFFDTENLEERIKDSVVARRGQRSYYGWLVSVIALKLIQEYGLDNQTLANMKTTDLCLENRVLRANGFELYITEGLVSAFELYIKSREFVVSHTEQNTNVLFIKKNGNPYLDANGRPDSGQLFLAMDSVLSHTNTTSLRYKTIVELVSKGANINLLSQLTKVDKGKIVEICPEDKICLENMFRGTSSPRRGRTTMTTKGQMRCPFCGDYKDASAQNWILIQVVGESEKRLACRECKGFDGTYRY